MAYTPKGKIFGEDDEGMFGGAVAQQSLPMSTPAPMGTAGGGTPATKQAPEAPKSTGMGPGTGFVNMDRLLGANAGIGNKVAQTGNTALAKERNNLTGEVGKFDKAVSEGSSIINTDFTPAIDRLFGGGQAVGGGGPGSSTIFSQGASDEDKDLIMSGLGATYGGPLAFNYKTTGALDEATALGSGKSAGKQLATNAGTKIEGGLAGYNPNVSALDRALYSTESSAVKATGDVAKGTKNLKTDINTISDNATQRATNAAKDVAGVRQGVLDRLIGGAQGIISDAEAQAAAANAKETELRMNPTGQNVTTGALTPEQQQQANTFGLTYSDPTWNPGAGPATAGNFIGDNAGKLDWIAKALEDPNLAVQNAGAYQGGSWSRTATPNAPPPQTSDAEEEARMVDQGEKREDIIAAYKSPTADAYGGIIKNRLLAKYPWLANI